MHNPLILSANHQVDVSATNRNLHTLVVSPSGGGKTVSFLEPNVLHIGRDSYVIRVSKRAFVEKYKPYCLDNGYQVYDLNLAHPEQVNAHSVSYDPLSTALDEDMIHRLSEQIVNLDDSRGSNADPYWAGASTELLDALTYVTLAEKRDATLADVLDCFDELTIADSTTDSGIEISLNERFQRLELKDPNHEAVRAWRSFATLPYRTAGCVYSSLGSVLQIFTKSVREAIRKLPPFRVEDFCKQKSVLFVTANPTDVSRFKISNLFFEDLIHNLIEEAEIHGGTLPHKTRLIIDDFGVGGVIEAVPAALSFVRETGISMNLMCQSLSQLNTMYGNAKATTIKNNCDNTVYIGAPNDLDTANEMALRINRPLTDMLTLREEQTLVCQRGKPPEIVERYRTLEDPLYMKVTLNHVKSPAYRAHTGRRVRKDFSPKRSKREALEDLTKEMSALTAKFDQRYLQLMGESLDGSKKKKTVKTD